MKKLIFALFLVLSSLALAYDPALNEAEALYKQAEQLTTEYIASFKTLKTLAANELTQEQKEQIDAIILHNERNLKVYTRSLQTLKKLMSEYDSLSDGERSAALDSVKTQSENLKTMVNSLENAIQMNKTAIEEY